MGQNPEGTSVWLWAREMIRRLGGKPIELAGYQPRGHDVSEGVPPRGTSSIQPNGGRVMVYSTDPERATRYSEALERAINQPRKHPPLVCVQCMGEPAVDGSTYCVGCRNETSKTCERCGAGDDLVDLVLVKSGMPVGNWAFATADEWLCPHCRNKSDKSPTLVDIRRIVREEIERAKP